MSVVIGEIGPDRKLFGKRLTLYRESAGLSVAELAQKAKTARQVIYDIENGSKNYTIDKFVRLLNACGISVEEFLRGSSGESEEFQDLYYMLRAIIKSGNKDLIHGIRISLDAVSEKARRLRRENPNPPPLASRRAR